MTEFDGGMHSFRGLSNSVQFNRRRSARSNRKSKNVSIIPKSNLQVVDEEENLGNEDVIDDYDKEEICQKLFQQFNSSNFLLAIRYGKFDIISRLFQSMLATERDQAVNGLVDNCGQAPLHLATKLGDVRMMEILLENGADVNLKGDEDKLPLHFAAKFYKCFTKDQIYRRKYAKADPPKECIRLLLDHGANVNARDAFHSTPLHYACQKGHVRAVEILLATPGIEVFVFNEQHSSPLHEAACGGHVEIVKMILSSSEHGYSLADAVDENGSTPLLLGCRDGHTEIARLLLNTEDHRLRDGAIKRLLDRDVDSNNPLHVAIESGNAETVEFLLSTWEMELNRLGKKESNYISKKSYIDLETGDGFSPLHLAADIGSLPTLDVLFRRNPQLNVVNHQGLSPLLLATKRRHLQTMEYLLRRGSDVEWADWNQLTPLLTACKNGHVDGVKLLLKYGAKIDATDVLSRNCLFHAAASNSFEMVQYLLNSTDGQQLLTESDRFGNTVLHESASSGNLTMLKFLFSYGLKICPRNDADQTPLHVAAINGNSDIVRAIVNWNRPSLFDQDEHSRTSLHLAACKGHLQTVSELLRLGAATADIDVSGMTPLHTCVVNGSLECAKEILAADPSVVYNKTRQKKTALHLACIASKEDMVKLLLKYNADVTARLPDGRNALDLAIDHNRESCVMVLLNSSSWAESLRNATFPNHSSVVSTPFRNLIYFMPDSAQFVLDKCVTNVDNNYRDMDHQIKFNYEFLEDSCQILKWKDQRFESQQQSQNSRRKRAKRLGGNLEMQELNRDDRWIPDPADHLKGHFTKDSDIDAEFSSADNFQKRYTPNTSELVANHPLNIMVEAKREKLLRHPVVKSLILYKWKQYGMITYTISLFIYLLYLSMLTLYVCTSPPRFAIDVNSSGPRPNNRTNQCVVVIAEAMPEWGNRCQGKDIFQTTTIAIIVANSAFQLTRNLITLYFLRKKFLTDYWNYVEIIVYILAIVAFVDFDDISRETGIRTGWQGEISAFVLLLSWINLSSFLKQTPLGIYVFMVSSVAKSFMRFFPLLLIYVIGFSLGFFVLLQNQVVFKDPVLSFIKTFVMTMGEYEYTEIFFGGQNDTNYSTQVGIAVDDIALVYDQALLKQLAVQVQSFLGFEFLFPEALYRRFLVEYSTARPNKSKKFKFIQPWLKELNIDDMSSVDSTIYQQTETEAIYEEIKALKYSIHQLSRSITDLIEKEQKKSCQSSTNAEKAQGDRDGVS